MRKLAILDTDILYDSLRPRYQCYGKMFSNLLAEAGLNWEIETFSVIEGEYPAELDSFDAFLITGSKFDSFADTPWIVELREYVRRLYKSRMPMVGICFGHQLVAQALGGKTEKSPKGWGVGIHQHRFQQLPAWHDQGAAAFAILVSHQDQVVSPALGADVLAGSEFCENAVCQVGEHILTFQGHPEFVPGYAQEVMQFRRERIGEEAYTRGMASLAEDAEAERVGRWILAFLRN